MRYSFICVAVFVEILLTGCLLETGVLQPATPIPTTTVTPASTAPSVTPEVEDPTTTPAPDATTPTETAVASMETPINSTPVVFTNDATNVRLGPGLHYPISHVLPGGVSAQILGRNTDSTWWAVPGPGDGSGPHGWIAGSVVTVSGDTSTLPILPAPPTVTLPPTITPSPTVLSVPEIRDPGSPPTNACVAINPDETQLINVHLGPGLHFGLVARLGNWAEVLHSENGWYQILIGPGQTGWVDGAAVELTGPCDGSPPAASVFAIVDGDTGALLGSWHDAGWLHAAATARRVGEARYRLFAGSTEVATVRGSAPAASGGICNQPAVTLQPAPPLPGTIGVMGPWNPAPRTPAPAVDAVEPKEIVTELLRQRGIPEPEVEITAVWEIDVEGDGTDELVIGASRFAAGSNLPSVSAGDYSLIVIQKTINGNNAIIPVEFDVYLNDEELAYPFRHSIVALLDLNGDGRLELVVQASRYEGRTLVVHEVVSDRAQPVLDTGCVQ